MSAAGFAKALPDHDVVTVGFLNWTGITNGALLKAAEARGLELLLTGDKGLAYQNDLGGCRIAVIALSAVSSEDFEASFAGDCEGG